MLSSISPVGEAARGQRWSLTIAAYTLSSTVAGGALGAVLGAAGGLVLRGVATTGRLWALAAVAAAGVITDATVGVPSLHRQVDQRWLTTYRGWVYGAGFGAQLGVGIATIVPASVVWLVWVAALLTGSWPAGLLLGATFGLARALPLVVAGRIRDVEALRAVMGRMDRRRASASQLALLGQVAVISLAVTATLL